MDGWWMGGWVSYRARGFGEYGCGRWESGDGGHMEKWGDDHELMPTMELVFLCKKCKRAFRKQVEEFEEADEYCPHCDNHFIIEAKTRETEGRLVVEV